MISHILLLYFFCFIHFFRFQIFALYVCHTSHVIFHTLHFTQVHISHLTFHTSQSTFHTSHVEFPLTFILRNLHFTLHTTHFNLTFHVSNFIFQFAPQFLISHKCVFACNPKINNKFSLLLHNSLWIKTSFF